MSVDAFTAVYPESLLDEGSMGANLTLTVKFNIEGVETAVIVDVTDIITIVNLTFADFLLVP
jgi:hypothetical protein